MQISLNAELEKFIHAQIATGRFNSLDEAMNEAVKLLVDRERRLEELRKKIDIGTEEINNGQVTDGEIVFTRLQEKLKKMEEELGNG